MLLYPKNEQTHLVLIVRNTYKEYIQLRSHSGGKYEETDVDFAYTALRETKEVGVNPDAVELIKPFTPMYIPPSNFMVHPFFSIGQRKFILNLIHRGCSYYRITISSIFR
jgi:hypothetical protein